MPEQQNRCNYGNWPNCLNVVASLYTRISHVKRVKNLPATNETNAKCIACKWCFKRREK